MAVAAAIASVPIFSQVWPSKECPKLIPFQLNFNGASPGGADEWTIDLISFMQQGKIEGVQACYYDNYINNQFVTLECPDTLFSMRFRPQFQGFRPLLLPDQPRTLKLTCSGGNGIMTLLLTNTPVQPLEWDAA